jgi:Glycosyl transferase family 2
MPGINDAPDRGARLGNEAETPLAAVAWQPDGEETLGVAGWRVLEGNGSWRRRASEVVLAGAEAEWHALALPCAARDALRAVDEVAIEATICGSATSAGLSFGPYLDFLAPPTGSWARRLSLELHVGRDTWTFRVDGRLTPPLWDGTPGARRLLDGVPSLKARGPINVAFTDVVVRRFPARCRLSVILTCHRFLQRLRVALLAWCRQDAPAGSFEVIVVNPASPDGTAEHLAAVATSFPDVRIRELFVDAPAHKPVLINHAVRASAGDWIWLTDADCLFPSTAVRLVFGEMDRGLAGKQRLLFGDRRHLRRADTDALLAMALDGVGDFTALTSRADAAAPEHYPWGYTQIVPRQLLLDIPYREDMRHFAHSDGAFVDACRRRGIEPTPVEGLYCLHLAHPFAWFGTEAYC